MMRHTWPVLAVFLLLALTSPGWDQETVQPPKEPTRREVFEPGLIVETGARLGACDVLTFTPDGRQLLATGDDKVVRIWNYSPRGLDADHVHTLRWSIFRESRGAIYALALSPDREARYVVAGGHGLRNSSVAVLDRFTGDVKHGGTPPTSATVWSLAFAPSGDQVAIGCDDGSVWLWDLNRKGKDGFRRLGKHPGAEGFDYVRLVQFRDEGQVLSVAEDGQVVEWDARRTNAAPAVLFHFTLPQSSKGTPKLARVVMSPDRKWLAAAVEANRVVLQSVDGKHSRDIVLPPGHFPHSLAFDPRGERLAVGIRVVDRQAAFFKEVDDEVRIYDLTTNPPRFSPGPKPTFHPEALAFPPDGDHLAMAGGNDQEVTLWDLGHWQEPVSVIRSPGSCLWGVALSPDGRYLGYQDQRDPNPPGPNHRGRGPWKVFDLYERQWATARDLRPADPLERAGGWGVQPDRENAFVWYVVGPDGRRFPLPLEPRRDAIPRCYTFLKPQGGRVLLVVGHYWGASLFQLTREGPKRVRQFTGHQGEVMALAVSADQKMLVTASRDQTIAGWSLEPWPDQPELGARFRSRGGRLEVEAVDPGSPAWEAGLHHGDDIVLFAYAGREVPGGPDRWLEVLRDPQPGRECYFRVQREGSAGTLDLLTTVRQRPRWMFFPTRDREWLLWRFRDYYYDTSTRGDYYAGWQISGEVDQTPTFYPAERYRRRYHRPDKVAALVRRQPGDTLEAETLADVEAPAVHLELGAGDSTGLPATLTVQSRGDRANQQLDQVILWINDYRFRTWPAGGGNFRQQVIIPRDRLRSGTNYLTLQCYNRAGARGQAGPQAVSNDRPAGEPNLYGLMVGVGDYRRAQPPLTPLNSDQDARTLQETWSTQQHKLYRHVDVRLIPQDQVTPEEIRRRLRELAGKVQPDDRLVFYLGGHGTDVHEVQETARKTHTQVLENLRPGNFWFCCPDFDLAQPSKGGLTLTELYELVASIPCRKIVLLDTCHSGTVGVYPVRELTLDGVGPLILTACDPREAAIEHETIGLGHADAKGLFTIAVLMALDSDFDNADQDHDGLLEAGELVAYVKQEVQELVQELKQDEALKPEATQTPRDFLPDGDRRLPLAQK